MEYMKKMKQMPSEKPALTATVGSRETEGVAGAFPPRIDRGDREGRRRSGHTQPCFGSAFALLAFCHDAWKMVVMVVKDQSCRGLGGSMVEGGWWGLTFLARTRLESTETTRALLIKELAQTAWECNRVDVEQMIMIDDRRPRAEQK